MQYFTSSSLLLILICLFRIAFRLQIKLSFWKSKDNRNLRKEEGNYPVVELFAEDKDQNKACSMSFNHAGESCVCGRSASVEPLDCTVWCLKSSPEIVSKFRAVCENSYISIKSWVAVFLFLIF